MKNILVENGSFGALIQGGYLYVDTFDMGYDWKGKFDYLKEEGVEVVYLPHTLEISTTQIKHDLHEFDNSLKCNEICTSQNARGGAVRGSLLQPLSLKERL